MHVDKYSTCRSTKYCTNGRWLQVVCKIQKVQVSLLVKVHFACYLQRSTLATKPAFPMPFAIFPTCKSARSTTTWVLLRLLYTTTRRPEDQETRGQVVQETRGQEVQEDWGTSRRGGRGPGNKADTKKRKCNKKKHCPPLPILNNHPMRIQDYNTSASTTWTGLPDLLPSTESLKKWSRVYTKTIYL